MINLNELNTKLKNIVFSYIQNFDITKSELGLESQEIEISFKLFKIKGSINFKIVSKIKEFWIDGSIENCRVEELTELSKEMSLKSYILKGLDTSVLEDTFNQFGIKTIFVH